MKTYLLILGLLSWFAPTMVAQEKPTTLELKKVLGGSIEMLLPVEFEPLDSAIIAFKYPRGNAPKEVYSNVQANVNIAFTIKEAGKITDADIGLLIGVLAETFKQALPGSKILGQGLVTQNGSQFGYVELKAEAVDTDIYNLLYFTVKDGNLVIIGFNCVNRLTKTWKKVAKEMMSSIKLN